MTAEKTWKELYRVQESHKTESNFSEFCAKNSITCYKLDIEYNITLREKYLKNVDSYCPDFIIKKDKKFCFVEAKTLTNFTNSKREKEIDTKKEVLQKK